MRSHMPCFTAAALLFSLLLSAAAHSQTMHPEELAGPWETADGLGGYIGLNLWITTTVPGSATSLARVSETLESLDAGLYLRKTAKSEPERINTFSTSPKGGAAWDGTHLHFDLAAAFDVPEIHVALTWHPQDRTWTGLLQRAAYRNPTVTLRRPANARANLLVGTWTDRNPFFGRCLHIAQADDGVLFAWSDQLQALGRVRYANGLQRPAQAVQHFGERAKLTLSAPGQLTIELWADTAMCCPHPFTARLSPGGNALLSEWSATLGQIPGPTRWTRVHAASCIASIR